MLENLDSLIARARRLAEERAALWERAEKLAAEVRQQALQPKLPSPAAWPAGGMAPRSPRR